ncbi:hypothetical protein N7474_004100 [Penicillium riverlandense]|uniref:uncharacterized protein n=1 Tax=Penicillium riverlandense TaxID=1903569 RepID=UPI0025485403|nr:uncharacterized protein N7474_004100 [Penicillium riverlandense]KAJ5818509.1 hypothetical protein N7474_004100 [Penicillium riverlandense]
MVDVEEFIAQKVLEKCKLYACVDRFLARLSGIRGDPHSRPIPDFSSFNKRDTEKLKGLAVELQADINRLLPGYLGDNADALSNPKLKRQFDDRWPLMQNKRQKLADEPATFRQSLLETLAMQQWRQMVDTEEDDGQTAPALAKIAWKEARKQLESSIISERKSASFVCGGIIPIEITQTTKTAANVSGEQKFTTAKDRRNEKGSPCTPSSSAFMFTFFFLTSLYNSLPNDSLATTTIPGKELSPPVHIFWAPGEDNKARKLILPVNDDAVHDSSMERLRQLVVDCDVASFGKGQQDVVDPEYRKAGKLDPRNFATSFHPADFGILENVEQVLLPSISTDIQNRLPFRKLSTELYKLNVYSGPSGLFRKHVDTPRADNQIGSLVVCLPSSFKGGDLLVRHHGKEVVFDWSSHSTDAIQWAAFYSDREHEIKTVSDGERITLTYNLYVTEPVGGSIPPNIVVDPKTLPLYDFLRGLVTQPGFMKDGGVLGIYCSHAYPHSSDVAQELLPRALKGADLVLYSVFKWLDIKVEVRPVLSNVRDFEDDYEEEESEEESGGDSEEQSEEQSDEDSEEAPEGETDDENGEQGAINTVSGVRRSPQDLPREVTPAELEFIRDTLSAPADYMDVDKRWKTLYFSLRMRGKEAVSKFTRNHRLWLKSNGFFKNKGEFVGQDLLSYKACDYEEEEGEGLAKIIDSVNWPADRIPGITWIANPGNEELAFSYIAYGNQASLGSMYSCAAILAVIPPFDQRQAIMGQEGCGTINN